MQRGRKAALTSEVTMSEKRSPSADDHQSDPARVPGSGWVGEGGASHLGPATHTRGWASGNVEADDNTAEESAEAEAGDDEAAASDS